MPIARATAPVSEAPGRSVRDGAKRHADGEPFGDVVERDRQDEEDAALPGRLQPLGFLDGSPRCRWGRILSTSRRNDPAREEPDQRPAPSGQPGPSAISIAGARSDQKLAAIMTPAAKPSMASSTLSVDRLEDKDDAGSERGDEPGEAASPGTPEGRDFVEIIRFNK